MFRRQGRSANQAGSARSGLIRRYFRAIRGKNRAMWQRVGLALMGLMILAMIPVLAVFIYALTLIPSTPTALQLQRATESRPTIVLAVGGEKLTQFEAPFREWVPLDAIPQHVVDAL
ncbi:MAG: hypothetical protein R3284_03340, partial [Rubricoccaceae bacterium]|nr:hypothetical protein [Rubricoccaceae bacterium]